MRISFVSNGKAARTVCGGGLAKRKLHDEFHSSWKKPKAKEKGDERSVTTEASDVLVGARSCAVCARFVSPRPGAPRGGGNRRHSAAQFVDGRAMLKPSKLKRRSTLFEGVVVSLFTPIRPTRKRRHANDPARDISQLPRHCCGSSRHSAAGRYPMDGRLVSAFERG